MTPLRTLVVVLTAAAFGWPLHAQAPPAVALPIIDMHLHALEADAQGPPPMGVCPGRSRDFPRWTPGRPWPETFFEHLKKPPCATPIWSPTTSREIMERTFAVMKSRNVYGVTSGSLTERWKQALPERIIPSLEFELGTPRGLSVDAVRDGVEERSVSRVRRSLESIPGLRPERPGLRPVSRDARRARSPDVDSPRHRATRARVSRVPDVIGHAYTVR